MTFSYCKSWFRAKKHVIGPMTVEDTRKAHEARRQYTVLLGDPGKPVAFAEIVGDYIGVGFLDPHLREHLSHQFQEKGPGRLFLTMATHRQFEGDSDRVARGSTYVFSQDGAVRMERKDFVSQSVEVWDTRTDVSGNWDVYPAFGEDTAILRRER